MKNVKPTLRSMRTDFEFSTDPLVCRNSSWLGFSRGVAAPGDWVRFRSADADVLGRVIGTVNADGSRYLMVAALSTDATFPMMRWVEPAAIVNSQPGPPRRVLEWITGEWDDPQAICDAINNGFVEDWERT